MSDDRFDAVASDMARRYGAACEFKMLTEIKQLREYGAGLFINPTKLESPIEELFAAGLTYCIRMMERRRFHKPRFNVVNSPEPFEKISGTHPRDVSIAVWAQQPIGQYRVDFLVRFAGASQIGNLLVAIECDGHEFHEKTKEQVARDKARDNELQSQNIVMLRYPGSVVWRDPVAAAADALQKIELMELRRLVAQGEDFQGVPVEMLVEKWGRD